MTKPLISLPGNASERSPVEDPLPQWRELLSSSAPEALIKLLVDIAAWAQQHPKSAEAWTLLGDMYLHIKQPYAAERAFTAALGILPKLAPAREGLGLALLQTARPVDAVKHLGIAHKLDPSNADILVHWGLALVDTRNLKAAHNRFMLALQCDPRNPHAWLNLGLVDTQRGAWHDAINRFQQAVALKSDFAEALHNLALAYRHVGLLEPALRAATTLSEHHPRQVSHWILLAELRLNKGELDEAKVALQTALEVDPSNPDIYVTRAMLYSAHGQYADAEAVLKTALTLSQDNPNIQLEMGHLHLLLQRFESGWDLHEARRLIALSPVRRFPFKDWKGEDLSNQTVLVHAEQGLGDTIMYAHCLPDLLQVAGHVVIEVSTRLSALFARSFPTATVIGRDPKGADLQWLNQLSNPIDYQIPIGSLPRHFRRQLGQFHSHAGYLSADPIRVEHWRKHLAKYRQPVWGIAWRGGLPQTGREQRSLPLEALVPILQNSPVQWISLQYGEASDDVIQSGLDLPHWPESLTDQDEVAALTCALDGVLTVCSTQAHLTGALGCHGYVLTPFSPNWRYGTDGNTMPWYPSLTLLRQHSRDDWENPLTQIRALLY